MPTLLPDGEKLSRAQVRAEELIQKHLLGYMSVISHRDWSDLRDEVAAIIQKTRKKGRRKVRKK